MDCQLVAHRGESGQRRLRCKELDTFQPSRERLSTATNLFSIAASYGIAVEEKVIVAEIARIGNVFSSGAESGELIRRNERDRWSARHHVWSGFDQPCGSLS
jgi:hypothetical protein